MNDDVTMDELIQDILTWSDKIGNARYIAGELSQGLDNIAYGIRQNAPQDTGALRNSIQLLAEESSEGLSVVFSMLNYGYYQNYGVKGTDGVNSPFNSLSSTNINRQQPFGLERPAIGPFSFGTRKSGIPATPFFNYQQVQQQVNDLVNEKIQNISEEL